MFWGLRECRKISLQAIQQAEVTIECAGAKKTRTITDVQKYPNFESSPEEADKYKLIVVRMIKSINVFFFVVYKNYIF